ncbi:MAG TPA: heme-binding protein [Acidocella sp.]|nr:heme-binding protein [Acidocella sp.]
MRVIKSALALAPTIFGQRSGTEEPRHSVIADLGPVEIRAYAPRLAASVTVTGDEISARSAGFRRLAAFIFGANTTRTGIAMTAPVVQSGATIAMTAPVVQSAAQPGSWTITFYMPSGYTLATLPKPTDPGITVQEVPGDTLAVHRFTGARGAAAIANATTFLLGQLSASAWEPAGDAVSWFYDPPWTLPWTRRNEVAVPVKPRQR